MQESIGPPEKNLEHEHVLGVLFGVSPSQASVLSCLTRASLVSVDDLQNYTGITSKVKIPVSRARAKLRKHGIEINSKVSVGYWIDVEDRNRINAMVDEFIHA